MFGLCTKGSSYKLSILFQMRLRNCSFIEHKNVGTKLSKDALSLIVNAIKRIESIRARYAHLILAHLMLLMFFFTFFKSKQIRTCFYPELNRPRVSARHLYQLTSFTQNVTLATNQYKYVRTRQTLGGASLSLSGNQAVKILQLLKMHKIESKHTFRKQRGQENNGHRKVPKTCLGISFRENN